MMDTYRLPIAAARLLVHLGWLDREIAQRATHGPQPMPSALQSYIARLGCGVFERFEVRDV